MLLPRPRLDGPIDDVPHVGWVCVGSGLAIGPAAAGEHIGRQGIVLQGGGAGEQARQAPGQVVVRPIALEGARGRVGVGPWKLELTASVTRKMRSRMACSSAEAKT